MSVGCYIPSCYKQDAVKSVDIENQSNRASVEKSLGPSRRLYFFPYMQPGLLSSSSILCVAGVGAEGRTGAWCGHHRDSVMKGPKSPKTLLDREGPSVTVVVNRHRVHMSSNSPNGCKECDRTPHNVLLKTLTWSYTLTSVLCGNGTRSQGFMSSRFSISQGRGLEDECLQCPGFSWLWRRADFRPVPQTEALWENTEHQKRQVCCRLCVQRPELFGHRAQKKQHNRLLTS
ncbi:uncharacterized protein LOC132377861 [Hypanus sabinus]|uniref:uncharacterized protein LOC132377861 n=1 Tax=Hypanus sabinus TaxID=79690 RepID=UPI0028C4ACD5|nr:uncharacterized protein LOC132377861 [Hypanus sabinus]